MAWRPVPSVSAGDAPARTDDEKTVRLLGPFHVAHDSEGIAVNGAAIAELSAGMIVTEAWAIITESFDGTALFIGAGDASTGDWVTITNYQNDSGPGATTPTGGAVREAGATTRTENVAMVLATCDLLVATSGSPTQGEADIYALILDAT